MKKIIGLSIDTTDMDSTEIRLVSGKIILDCKKSEGKLSSQIILPMIDEILKKNNIKLLDINFINVENRQGSYTGIRVGFSVANMLGVLLDIKVNGSLPENNQPMY